jgi:hypothetical protein
MYFYIVKVIYLFERSMRFLFWNRLNAASTITIHVIV